MFRVSIFLRPMKKVDNLEMKLEVDDTRPTWLERGLNVNTLNNLSTGNY
jgi:hypothetical protein